MTDKEWMAQIGNESNESLRNELVYFGCDGYYADLWKAVLRELCNRLNVDFKKLNIGE